MWWRGIKVESCLCCGLIWKNTTTWIVTSKEIYRLLPPPSSPQNFKSLNRNWNWNRRRQWRWRWRRGQKLKRGRTPTFCNVRFHWSCEIVKLVYQGTKLCIHRHTSLYLFWWLYFLWHVINFASLAVTIRICHVNQILCHFLTKIRV